MIDEEFQELNPYTCEGCGTVGAQLYRGWLFLCPPCTDKREEQ